MVKKDIKILLNRMIIVAKGKRNIIQIQQIGKNKVNLQKQLGQEKKANRRHKNNDRR